MAEEKTAHRGKVPDSNWKRVRLWPAQIANRIMPDGLSSRLLVLTILFVLLSEILIYLPSIVAFRSDVLMQRLEAAQLAALSLEAAENNSLEFELTEELLANAEVKSVILKRDERRSLFLSPDQMPPMPEQRFDLVNDTFIEKLIATFNLLMARSRAVNLCTNGAAV